MNTANLSFGFILQAVPCPESPKDMQIRCFQMTRRLIFRFHEMNPWHSHLILFHSLARDRFTAPNLNFYSFARASKFKGSSKSPSMLHRNWSNSGPKCSKHQQEYLCWLELVSKIPFKGWYGDKNWPRCWNKNKNCSPALRGLPRMAFWAAALSSCQWYSPALVERMQPEIGYKGRTFIASGPTN